MWYEEGGLIMSRNKKSGYVILLIAFVVVSVVVFAVPTEKTTSFWVAYIFTCVAFGAQILLWNIGFRDNSPLKSRFLGIPVVRVGYIYLVLQLIALAVLLLYPQLPVWATIIINVLIVGISTTCTIMAEIGRNVIGNVEEKVQSKVFYIREIQTDIEIAAERQSDSATKQKLLNLAEKVRYSDPISSDELSEIEKRISDKVKEL
ncbi:MAG: hypothetical protein HUJ90_06755, partial [Bacteroidales bacterium]|nr:hypothetical protein [Bacteroidales bacterium]